MWLACVLFRSASLPPIGVVMYHTDIFLCLPPSFTSFSGKNIHNPQESFPAYAFPPALSELALQAVLRPVAERLKNACCRACLTDCLTRLKNRARAFSVRLNAYPLRFVNDFTPKLALCAPSLENGYALQLCISARPTLLRLTTYPHPHAHLYRSLRALLAQLMTPHSTRPTHDAQASRASCTPERLHARTPYVRRFRLIAQRSCSVSVVRSPSCQLVTAFSASVSLKLPNLSAPTANRPTCQSAQRCALPAGRSYLVTLTETNRGSGVAIPASRFDRLRRLVGLAWEGSRGKTWRQRAFPGSLAGLVWGCGKAPRKKTVSCWGAAVLLEVHPLSGGYHVSYRRSAAGLVAVAAPRRRDRGHGTSITCPLRYIWFCFFWLCKPVHALFSLSLVFSCSPSCHLVSSCYPLTCLQWPLQAVWALLHFVTPSACFVVFTKEVVFLTNIHVVNAGVDTFVVNVYYLDDMGKPIRRRELDPAFVDRLNGWKVQAQNQSEPYPTDLPPFRGAQLLMQPNGAGRGQWQWMLKTSAITLYISRGLWNGIASVRFNSEFLWSCPGLTQAIVDVHAFLYEVFDKQDLQLQPSSIDLCADIAGWDDIEHLNKKRHFVSHSRKRRQDAETDPQEGLKASDHSYGLHDTGFDFSSRGPMSLTIYDKTRYIKQDGKTWFLPLWELHGWDPEKEPDVWRVEAKFKREVLRDLTWQGQHGIENAYDVESLLPLLWAYAVGHVGGGADGLPDGWLRCVRPGKDKNRARWVNHPAWDVVQRAFSLNLEQPPHFGTIIRQAKEEHNIEKALGAVLGYATSLAAWVGGALAAPDADLSVFLHWLAENGQDHLEKKDRDFALEVLKKSVKIGKRTVNDNTSSTASSVGL